MSDREQALTPPFIGRIALLGALFLVTLPHFFRFPVWLSAIAIGVFIWRLLHELRGYDLPGRWLRVLLVFAGVGSVLAVYRSIIGQDAGVALLTLMLCFKLLELRTMRDALIALFIGYFMVIGGFIFDQSIFMGAYLFIVVLALTAALIALNHPAGNATHLRFYLTTGGKLLLQSLPLMVVMFILFPRLSGPLWSMPEDLAASKTGLSDSIEMGSISKLVKSEEVAFRVDFKSPIPPADALYWRGPVLWQTDGRRWERLRFRPGYSLPAVQSQGSPVDYTITQEPNNRRWLFSLDVPLDLPRGLSQPVFALPDFQIMSFRTIATKIRYSLRSATNYRLTELPGWMKHMALQLPSKTNPRTREMAQHWRSEESSDFAIVQRALSMFREQPFYYTRQPPRLGQDPVDEFLFTTRRGFCEHYASAFVTLMRAAGIPARVVTGYQGGELNELGDYLIIRQSNAHAWAEVWLGKQGWVRFDPTAVIPRSRVETSNDATRFQSTSTTPDLGSDYPMLRKVYWKFRQTWDAINHTWSLWVLGFDKDKQQELLRKLGLTNLSWQWLIGVMFALIAAILGVIGGLTLLRRPRQRDPVLGLYLQFCSKFEAVGLVRDSDEGPADFAARVIAKRPELAESVNRINELYIRLRYTRHADEKDLQVFRNQVKAFKV